MSFLIFQNYKKRIESEGKYYDFVTKELKFDKYIWNLKALTWITTLLWPSRIYSFLKHKNSAQEIYVRQYVSLPVNFNDPISEVSDNLS